MSNELSYTEYEEALGEEKWDDAFIASLPDASFAIVDENGERHLYHHNDSVVKGAENSSVDKAHLILAIESLKTLELSDELKMEARGHLTRHAKALGNTEDEISVMFGDEVAVEDEAPTLSDKILSVDTFEDAEDLLCIALDSEDEDLIMAASEKASALMSVGRENISDSFEGALKLGDKLEDGIYQFSAIVAQADKINKNKRMYPKKEFEANMKRVNMLCKAGKFTGRDGHAGWLDSDKPSEICVRFDRVYMQGDDLVMEGVLIPTQAGLDIATLWDNGVKTEWSIVGYGTPVLENAGKSDEYYRITDYILEGCDPVRRGAAKTKTVKMSKSDSLEIPGEDVIMSDELELEVQDEPETQPVADNVGVDVKAITDAAVAASIAEAAKAAGEAATQAVKEAIDAARKAETLEKAKSEASAKLADGDSDLLVLVSRHFDRCADAEDVAKVVEEITPMIEGLRKPKQYTGIGVHAKSEKEVGWFNGNRVTDRPETAGEVREGLLDGLADNGQQNPSNMRWTFEKMLDNYEKNHPEYFHACTRRGFGETATGTSALGTQLPAVLPMIRQIFPMLIPYEIQSVQPLAAPTGRVHFLDFEYDSGTSDGSSIDDTSQFDTGWADHVEAETKSKMALSFTHTDLTVADKSIYYEITSNLMQDMKALHGLDAEAEIMSAAADQIAREINMKYLEMIAAGAGTSAGTFGLTKPSGWDSQEKWYDQGLSLYVNSAMSVIGEKFYTAANWAFTTPKVASMFSATNRWESTDPTQVNQFGFGIRKEGVYDGKLTIYSVSWGKVLTSVKNKMVFGFYPPDWKYTGSVYAPYIPLYVSPQDSDASKNLLSRSVTTRAAMKVLQPNAFSTLTIAAGVGAEPSFVD